MTGPLLIHLDANAQIGLGHAVRTANLVRHLWDVELFLTGDGDALGTLFPTAHRLGIAHTPIDIGGIARDVGASGVLIDQPQAAAHIEDIRRASPCPVAMIDDYGGINSSDLVINGTVLPEYHRYNVLSVHDIVLTGGDYALIHDAFAACERLQDDTTRRLLIVAGSGQRAFDWLDYVLASISLEDWDEKTIVTGRAHPHPERIAAMCAHLNARHLHAISSEALAQETSRANAGLTTGGMIVYEALASGLPVAAFPQMENLEEEMAFFAAHGAIIDLGRHGGFDRQALQAGLCTLRNDRERRETMQRQGRNIIDGQGLQRAADALKRMLGLPQGEAA